MEGPSSCVCAWGPVFHAGGKKRIMMAAGSASGSEFAGATDVFGIPAQVEPTSPTSKGCTLTLYEAKIEAGQLEKKARHDIGSSRFEKLRWASGHGSYGIIVGMLSDGTVEIYSADRLLKGEPKPAKPAEGEAAAAPTRSTPLLSKVKHPHGNITGFDVRMNGEQLAVGGPNSTLSLWDLSDPTKPKEVKLDCESMQPHSGNVTDVVYNPSRQDILAVSTMNGMIHIWTIAQQKRLFAQLQANGMLGFTCIAWNPTNMVELAVGTQPHMQSGGMRGSPCAIQLWDVTNKLHPKAAFEGHYGGITSLAWSSLDTTMLASTASDGRLCLWNPKAPEGQEFTGELPTKGGRNLSAMWHSNMPLLASSAAMEGKLVVQSMHALPAGVAGNAAPGWLKRPVGAAFGFGGTLVAHGKAPDGQPANPYVKYSTLPVGDGELGKRALNFNNVLAGDVECKKQYCAEASASATERGDADAATVWGLLGSLLAEEPRVAVLTHLGIRGEDVGEPVEGTHVAQAKADECAKKALLSGDDALAHKWLVAGGRIADALVFSSVSQQFPDAMAAYFERNASSAHPSPSPTIIALVRGLVQGTEAVSELIAKLSTKESPLSWRETLALTATASRPDTLKFLCESLAEELVKAKDGDPLVCWLCAGNTDKVVEHIAAKIDKRKPEQIQQLVEMALMCHTVNEVPCTSESYFDLQCKYAGMLADQGGDAMFLAGQILVSAAHSHAASAELRWRLVNAHPHLHDPTCASPYEPFDFIEVAQPAPVAAPVAAPAAAWGQTAAPVMNTGHAVNGGGAAAVPTPSPQFGAHAAPVATGHHGAVDRTGSVGVNQGHWGGAANVGRPAAPVAAPVAAAATKAPALMVDTSRVYGDSRWLADTVTYYYNTAYGNGKALNAAEAQKAGKAHRATTDLLTRMNHNQLSEGCRSALQSLFAAFATQDTTVYDAWLTFVQTNFWDEFSQYSDIAELRSGW